MARSHDFGRGCETLAAEELSRRGWSVVARNFRLGHKEIDLIVRRGRLVAFVEVKGRNGTDFGHPLDAIGHAKQREIERVARDWVRRHGQPGDEYRFDAVSVLRQPSGTALVEHFEDAWRPGH
jgi:putative endonuclease